MTKTVYILCHVDAPGDEIIDSILDPNEESKPTIYFLLDLAQQELELYRERGLEYEIRTLTVNLN